MTGTLGVPEAMRLFDLAPPPFNVRRCPRGLVNADADLAALGRGLGPCSPDEAAGDAKTAGPWGPQSESQGPTDCRFHLVPSLTLIANERDAACLWHRLLAKCPA